MVLIGGGGAEANGEGGGGWVRHLYLFLGFVRVET
jgi:hypothetical protein